MVTLLSKRVNRKQQLTLAGSLEIATLAKASLYGSSHLLKETLEREIFREASQNGGGREFESRPVHFT